MQRTFFFTSYTILLINSGLFFLSLPFPDKTLYKKTTLERNFTLCIVLPLWNRNNFVYNRNNLCIKLCTTHNLCYSSLQPWKHKVHYTNVYFHTCMLFWVSCFVFSIMLHNYLMKKHKKQQQILCWCTHTWNKYMMFFLCSFMLFCFCVFKCRTLKLRKKENI